jgi:isoquinoline 1-oxidoreductase beta subunit
MNTTLRRRDFLKVISTAGAGLVIGFHLPARRIPGGQAETSSEAFAPNAWVQVAPEGKITLWVHRSELGQGVSTSLPMILAEELEADWALVEVKQAPYDKRFGDQGTGGSTSVRTSWEPLRKAGATAREMLVTAAAQTWGVEKSSCRADKGSVVHTPTNRRLAYGALAEPASKLPVPIEVSLKDPKDFRIIGASVRRTDAPAKVDGSAVFGIDVRPPGMLHAGVVRCPVFGGKLTSFDATKSKAVPGVRQVMQLGNRIAVVADNTWAALKGREALEVRWDEGLSGLESPESLRQQFEELTAKPAKVFRNDGDVEAALARATKKIDAVYELPYISHAPMEPPNCTAAVQKDRCEVWAPTQSPEWVHGAAKRITGLPDEAIRVNVMLSGGAFGRRWFPSEVEDALEISKALSTPVQVLWTREDDIQHDFYRPASYHRMSAGLDGQGWPIAWMHRYASTSIMGSFQSESPYPEAMELEGVVDFPYAVPNVHVEYAPATSAVPRGWLRSVAHTYTAFVVQSFLDELAVAGGKDPYEFRLHLLREPRKIPVPGGGDERIDTEKLRGVLELAAKKAVWGKRVEKGRGRGVAHHYSFNTYVAQVAEVAVTPEGSVRVERVVCAVDCGTIVNPDGVRAQLEGGIIYGLSAALKGEITVRSGRVDQSNFDDYEVLSMAEAPVIEVYFVPSTAPPTGVGEPGFPPIAPAVCNAIFAATGKRIRKLPVRLGTD